MALYSCSDLDSNQIYLHSFPLTLHVTPFIFVLKYLTEKIFWRPIFDNNSKYLDE